MIGFMDLPLVIAQDIIKETVIAGEIYNCFQIRRVNRFFENEVTKYLVTTRLEDLEKYYPFVRFHGSENKILTGKCCEDETSISRLRLKLFLHAVGNGDQIRTCIASAMHRVTCDLVSILAQSTRNLRQDEILQDVCKAALVCLDWGVFSCMLSEAEYTTKQYQIPNPQELNWEIELEPSSFIVAMVSGYTEVWTTMMATGMKLNTGTFYFGTPLQMTIRTGRCDIAKMLLDHGMEVGRESEDLENALILAAQYGRVEIVKMLIDPKFRLRKSSRKCLKALESAVQTNHVEIAEIILNRDRRKENILRTRTDMFWWACRNGNNELVRKMLDAGIDAKLVKYRDCSSTPPCGSVVVGTNTAICGAAVGGHCNTVRILLDQGCRLGRFNASRDVFDCAATAEQFDVMDILLKSGHNVFSPSGSSSYRESPSMHTAFCSAVQNGQLNVIKFLMDRGFNIDSYEGAYHRRHVLRLAIRFKRGEILQWLVSDCRFSVDKYPDAREPDDRPMMDALREERPRMVDLLFQLGAEPLELENATIKRYFQAGYSLSCEYTGEEVAMTEKIKEGIEVHRRWEKLIKERVNDSEHPKVAKELDSQSNK